MYGTVATAADWPIIGDIARIFGFLMNWIFEGLTFLGIYNVGVSIIVLTIIIFTLMLPLTIKQQKGMKLQQVMAPEIKKIQKKYAGKRDQATAMKQQEEMRMLYQKYGTSMFNSCIPMLMTMPILLAFFPVVQNIPRYVASVRALYNPLVDKLVDYANAERVLQSIGEDLPFGLGNLDYSYTDNIYNLLARLQEQNWIDLAYQLPAEFASVIETTRDNLWQVNNFLGINMSENPINMFTSSFEVMSIGGMALATLIPVSAAIAQFVSMKLQPQPAADPDNPMARQMRTMIYFMPLLSVFFGFTFPAGLGLYWAISAVVRTIQMYFINKYLKKKTIEVLIEENQAKAERRRARRNTTAPSTINQMATKATRNMEDAKSGSNTKDNSEVTETVSASTGGGSLADKANMVRRYNSGKGKGNSDEK
jgi:YidC/Oxa1 family membrane protein insertase